MTNTKRVKPIAELAEIVAGVRAEQHINDGSLWDSAVDRACDAFAEKLPALLFRMEEQRVADIRDVESEYEGCPNRYGLVYPSEDDDA